MYTTKDAWVWYARCERISAISLAVFPWSAKAFPDKAKRSEPVESEQPQEVDEIEA